MYSCGLRAASSSTAAVVDLRLAGTRRFRHSADTSAEICRVSASQASSR